MHVHLRVQIDLNDGGFSGFESKGKSNVHSATFRRGSSTGLRREGKWFQVRGRIDFIPQSHSYQTESVLSLATAFASVRDVAAAAHERIDGSGYHRGTRSHDPRAGLLAAADVYDALTHDRPWRAAYDAARAADLLLAETKAGRLHREAARAILDTAGHGRRASQQVYPAGLSSREAEILVLLARGASTKAIADALGISPKTADHHVQRVYEKTGARGRPAAALYALRHGFVPE